MKMKKIGLVLVVTVGMLAQSALAESGAVLLEQGIYTEETVGDVKTAIGIYQQIVADGQENRKIMAEALFRLGRCYAAEGEKAIALKTLETLTQQFPEQKIFLEQAAKLMPDLKPPLPLQAAPWKNGEALHYQWTTKTGIDTGHEVESAYEVEQDGVACWKMQRQIQFNNGEIFYGYVIADKASFVPRASYCRVSTNSTSAVFSPGRVTLTKSSDSENSSTINVTGSVFGYDQALYVLRCLPLQEGYQATLPIVDLLGEEALCELRFQVLARETVTIPAGTFDCWKAEAKIYSDGVQGLEYVGWLSVKECLPVKYSCSTGINVELVDQSVRGAAVVALKKHDVRLKMPADWYLYELPPQMDPPAIATILPPKMNLWACFCGNERDSGDTRTVDEVVEGDIKVLKDWSSNYTVRSGSKKCAVIRGCPSETYAADYMDGKQCMVEYRTYYLTDAHIYWFIFRVPKETFESVKPALDEMINGISFSKQH